MVKLATPEDPKPFLMVRPGWKERIKYAFAWCVHNIWKGKSE